jgi:uncharacterized protein
VVIEQVDEANHSARLAASGKDTKGAGTARATVDTRLEPAGDGHTRMLVSSDVQLTGRVASFGRGGAINDVAAKLFGEFADCLRNTLEAEQAAATEAAATGTAAPEAAPAPAQPARPVEVGGLIVPLLVGVLKAAGRGLAKLLRRVRDRRRSA